MTMERTFLGVLMAALLLTGTAACDVQSPVVPPTATSSQPKTGSASPTEVTATPTPSVTPTDDAGRAVAAVVDYWKAIDSAAMDPSVNLETLASVSRGQALAQWQTTIAGNRAKKLTQVGRSEVLDRRVLQHDKLNRPGSGGGSQSMEDESYGSTEEVRRRAA